MLNNLKSIRIKGNDFFEDNDIVLFNKPKESFSFIYGNNGSGKTTIAKGFDFLKGNCTNEFSSVELINTDSLPINISDDDKNNIYIFNEMFIDQHVRIPTDGMSTIVMFGEQVKIDEQIKELELELRKQEDSLNKNNKIIVEQENEKSFSSPKYHQNILEEQIKKIWYTNDAKIRKLSKKAPYNIKTFNDIMNSKFKKDISFEENCLKDNISFIENINSEAKHYNNIVFSYTIDNNYDSCLTGLLKEKIEKPELSEREKKIFTIFTSARSNNIVDAKDFFNDKTHNYCPYCFQDVSEQYKNILYLEIAKVLNKEVEKHKSNLNILKLEHIICENINEYIDIDKKIIANLNVEIHNYNDEIDSINKIIEEKTENVYEPIDKEIKIYEKYMNIKNLFEILNNEIDAYNKKVSDIKKIQEESNTYNTIITRNKLNSEIETYNKILLDYDATKKQQKELTECIQNIRLKINDLNAQKKNVSIAMEEINDDLKYIFMSENRLTIDHENGKYIIKSRGKKVSPNKVSVGERNAIALSYFFTTIMNNTDKKHEYKNNFFLIIDDPISSFDNDNKIGMYSFIRSKINKILKNNCDNRVLIMTHSINAMFNFSSYAEDFKEDRDKFVYYVLKNKEILDYKSEKNLYSVAFNKVFDYADNQDDNIKYEIGNIVRKVLESFSTFEFKCSFQELSRKETILNKIPSTLKKYYENLMYRLFLNGESHFENFTYSMVDTDFLFSLNEVDKINVTRSLIVLIYLLNDIHVEGQLRDMNKLNKVKMWLNDLEKSQK